MKVEETNNYETRMRMRAGQCDTSQRGNWTNYRNEKLNGNPTVLDPSFFDPLPAHGFLEFDYVSITGHASDTTPISDRRFISSMKAMKWIGGESEDSEEVAQRTIAELELCKAPRKLLKSYIASFDLELAILREDPDITPEMLKHRLETNDARRRGAARGTVMNLAIEVGNESRRNKLKNGANAIRVARKMSQAKKVGCGAISLPSLPSRLSVTRGHIDEETISTIPQPYHHPTGTPTHRLTANLTE